jgi:uncharacterized protein
MKQIFTLTVESIPEEGLSINTEWDTRVADEIAQQDACEFKICAPLLLDLTFSLLGEKVILDGTLKTRIETTCVGCLSEFTQPLNINFHYLLRPQSDAVYEAEKELQQDDLDVGYYQGGAIDLQSIVREQMYLAVPQNPHCKEDCRGLCPACGANLNKNGCTCAVTAGKTDSPFNVLQKLKK